MRPIKLILLITFTLALLASASAQTITGQSEAVVQGTVDVVVAASCKDSAGNLYETAQSGVGEGSGSSVTEKLTPAGAVTWTNTFDLPVNYECFPYAVAPGLSGDAYVFGFLRNDLDYASSTYLIHISSAGETLWHIITPNSTYALGLTVDAAGNPIIELQTSTGFDLIKYNKTTGAAIYNVPQTFTLIPQQSLTFVNDLISNPAGYCYGIGHTTSGYFAVRFNEVTGAIMWNKPITAYGPFANYAPAYGIVLSSGDLLVAGSATNAASSTVMTLDRMGSTAGAFAYRTTYGVQTAGFSTTFNSAPVAGSANQAYWSISEVNNTTFASTNLLGKTMSTGTVAWSNNTSSGYSWLLAPSTSGGLFAAWSTATATNFAELSSTGGVVWTDSAAPATVPSPYAGFLSVNSSNDLSLAGGRVDPNQDNCFGLLTLSGTNHAILFNNYYLPDGDEDIRYSTSTHDAAGNTYFFETRNLQRYVDKVSPTGTVWRTYLGTTASGGIPDGICYSPLGYVAVLLSNAVTADPQIAKLNASTGAIVWETTLPFSSPTDGLFPRTIAIDGLGNVDVGSDIEGTTSKGMFGTLSTEVDQFKAANGAHTWNYSVPLTSGGGSITVDPANSVYVGGYSTSASEFVLTKLSDTGALIFSKDFAQAISAESVWDTPGLFCDSSGNTYLAISDAYTSYAATNNESILHLQSFNSAGVSRWQTTLYFNGCYEAKTLNFQENSGYLYVLSVIGKKNVSDESVVVKLNPLTGAQAWQNFHLNTLGSAQEFSVFNFDLYGNPVVAGESIPIVLYIGLYDFVPGQAFVHKIDALTGATRWDSISQGVYTGHYNHLTAVNLLPNNIVWVLGQTPCSTGPGSVDGLSLHYASAPFCLGDSYDCVENTALPSSSASVLANDQDVTGATCAVVASPTHAASFSLSAAGKISYTPVTGFVGTDTFTYKATTAYGVSSTAIVTIKVAA